MSTTKRTRQLPALDVGHGQEDEATAALVAAQERLTRAKAVLKRAQRDFDRTVALAVSSEPTSPTWYDSPGYVDRATVVRAAKLTSMQLHRLMERYRTQGGRR